MLIQRLKCTYVSTVACCGKSVEVSRHFDNKTSYPQCSAIRFPISYPEPSNLRRKKLAGFRKEIGLYQAAFSLMRFHLKTAQSRMQDYNLFPSRGIATSVYVYFFPSWCIITLQRQDNTLGRKRITRLKFVLIPNCPCVYSTAHICQQWISHDSLNSRTTIDRVACGLMPEPRSILFSDLNDLIYTCDEHGMGQCNDVMNREIND